MHVTAMEPITGSVSWTCNPVKYYLHVIDRTKVIYFFNFDLFSHSNLCINSFILHINHGILYIFVAYIQYTHSPTNTTIVDLLIKLIQFYVIVQLYFIIMFYDSIIYIDYKLSFMI